MTVLGDGLQVPAPPLPVQQGLVHTWTGWDGSAFDLTHGDAGVLMLADGVTGLHLPEFDQYIDEYAGVDGGRYRGTRTKVRQPSWTIGVFGDDTGRWRDRDQAWWRSLDPDRPGLWTVTDTDGRSRSLMCRLRSAGEHAYGRDPVAAGWAVYTVDLLAEQPYWSGAPVSSPVWALETRTFFTGPQDSAPPLYVSGASTIGKATLTNPGDVDGWLTWTVTGPVESVTVGTQWGFGAVPDGSVLRVSTDPTAPVATLAGADVTGQVTPWDPRPIPAGQSADLEITLVGSGSIQATFTPRYRRAI